MLKFGQHKVSRAIVTTICLGAGLAAGQAGEKIEFSTSKGSLPETPAIQRKVDGPNSRLFESPSAFPSVVAPSLPSATPDRSKQNEELDRRKNWIFVRPGDSAFDRDDSRGKEQALFSDETKRLGVVDKFLQGEETAKRPLTRDTRDSLDRDERRTGSSSLFHQPNAAVDTGLWKMETAREGLFDTRNTAGMDSLLKGPLDDMDPARQLLRRNDYRQLIEPPVAVPNATVTANNPLTDAATSRLPLQANDVYGRTTQTSLSDQWKGGANPLTDNRPSILQDPNVRALGQSASTFEREAPQPLRATPQPSIIPLPQRPGDLFKRPGAF